MLNFMQGSRTWAGLIIIIFGWVGLSDIVTEGQVSTIIDIVMQLVGMAIAIYGNYRSHREIKALGGYR